jgi:hypothetical protein
MWLQTGRTQRLLVGVCVVSGVGAVAAVVQASSPDSPGVMHACVNGMTCARREASISSSQTGPTGKDGSKGATGLTGRTAYEWDGSAQDVATGLTDVPAGSTVTVVSASISGDFSACSNGIVFLEQTGRVFAAWPHLSGPVANLAPASTQAMSTSVTAPLSLLISLGCPSATGFTFKIKFSVAPPTTA